MTNDIIKYRIVLQTIRAEPCVICQGLTPFAMFDTICYVAGKLFDLLIMDLTIPGGMGGKEAVQRIHRINSEAKVIVSSGYSNDPIMANFRDYGFCSAIVKPFHLQELSTVINQILG